MFSWADPNHAIVGKKKSFSIYQQTKASHINYLYVHDESHCTNYFYTLIRIIILYTDVQLRFSSVRVCTETSNYLSDLWWMLF